MKCQKIGRSEDRIRIIFRLFVDPILWEQLSSDELVRRHHSRRITFSDHPKARLIQISLVHEDLDHAKLEAFHPIHHAIDEDFNTLHRLWLDHRMFRENELEPEIFNRKSLGFFSSKVFSRAYRHFRGKKIEKKHFQEKWLGLHGFTQKINNHW